MSTSPGFPQDEVKNLRPFTRFCCTIGEVPTSYLLSLTYEEQLLWLCDYLKNTVIPTINDNAEAVQELQNLYVQLKNYVDNYFADLDIQTEIDNKLDQMAEDGTLAKIIEDYATIPQLKEQIENVESELNNKIDTINNDISNIDDNLLKNNRNTKYTASLFIDTEERQNIEYVTDFLTRCANCGFKESQMIIHINSDGTILEDKSKFNDYVSTAETINIPITSIKIHGNYTIPNYQNTILDILSYFTKIDTVFIFNEQENNIYENGLAYPAVIKNNYSNIKNVGFTATYETCFVQNSITETQWQAIENSFDIIGIHVYPPVGSYSKASITKYDTIITAFNKPAFLIPWSKKLWITESGVLPYWQFLEDPDNFDITKLTDTKITIEPQRLFYTALKESNIAKRASKIIPWFLESGMNSNNYELFNVFDNIIKER